MLRLIKLSFLFQLFASISVFAQTDQNITATGQRETEPFIAVNPADSNNIIAAWMRISFPSGIATKNSTDGGITWSNLNFLPHFSPSITCTSADVSIAFNNSGTAFICYVDYKLTLDSGYVRVAKSTNGGASWSAPVNAINALDKPDLPIDRPWIVCDATTGPYAGKIYIVSKSYWGALPPHKIWITTSSDSGTTYLPITQLDNPITVGTLTNIMAVPTIGANGNFYAAYASWNTALDPFPRFVCTKSTDGGSTFTQTTIAYPVAGSAVTDTLYQGSYSMAANPADANNLIFQTTDARYGDPDILSIYSTNAGSTWSSSTPVRVNDDLPLGNGLGQEMSWGAFSPNGVFGIAWRDRRNGIPNDTSNHEIYCSISTDGGQTYKPNYCLSSASSPFINQIRGNDFLGVSLTNGKIFANWADNRNKLTTKEDIYVRKENLSSLTTIKDINNTNNIFSIYPNPTNNVLNISLNEKKSGLIILRDVNGKIVLEKTLNNQLNSVSIANFKNGSYVYKLTIDSINYTGTIIKQ